MLLEAWQYLRYKSNLPYVKKMGYLTEAIAMQQRAKRCRLQWGAHYQHCQRVIKTFCEQQDSHRTLLVLGAGSTQDLPLEYLSRRYQNIHLVDVVFLNSVRHRVEFLNNVHLVEHDVSESLSNVFQQKPKILPPVYFLNDAEVDAVISVNIVTQLPLLPLKWLQKQTSQLDDEQALAFAQNLIQLHLEYLKKFPKALLIADQEGIGYQDDKEIERFDPWWDLPPVAVDEDWFWELIPDGEVKRGFRQVHRVGVTEL